MSEFSYKTLELPVQNILLKEKGSKFIGYASQVSDEDDFKSFLADVKTQHPKATHHCYAFRLGQNGENYRANDDGEPNGSAGLPIYNQILANDLTNVGIIIVRYYGGTKLGVSGLVKAYKKSAKETLDFGKIIVSDLTFRCEITFKFSAQNEVFTLINKFAGTILDFDAAEHCTIKAELKEEFRCKFDEKVNELQDLTIKY